MVKGEGENKKHWIPSKQPAGRPAYAGMTEGMEKGNRMKLKIIFLMVFVPANCTAWAGNHASEKYFPIGIYGVTKPSELKILKKAGFDSFHAYISDAEKLSMLAEEAGKLGLKMTAPPDGAMNSAYSEKAKTWPMLAWYLFDEPDVMKLSAEKLENLDDKTKIWSPGQLTAFVIGESSPSLKYGHIADTMMLDWYPVPHLPLESAGMHIKSAIEGMRKAMAENGKTGPKPLWAVLQAFDWKNYRQRDPSKPRIGRFPSREEIRFMTYHAVLSGAEGIFYYTLDTSDTVKNLYDFPQEWKSLTDTVAEISSLKRVFERGEETDLPFKTEGAPPAAKAWKHKNRRYLIIANPANLSIALPRELLNDGKWKPLFEKKGKLADLIDDPKNPRIAPYRVFVLMKSGS